MRGDGVGGRLAPPAWGDGTCPERVYPPSRPGQEKPPAPGTTAAGGGCPRLSLAMAKHPRAMAGTRRVKPTGNLHPGSALPPQGLGPLSQLPSCSPLGASFRAHTPN